MKSEIINGLFVLFGTLISVISVWIIARSGKEQQKITLIISACSKLLDVSDHAKPDVQITYREKSIKDLSAGEFATQNTGTKALENIEIDVVQSSDSPLLDFEISSTNFSAAESFINIELNDDESYKATIQYLNPKDSVIFKYHIAGVEKPNISVRKLGLDVKMRYESITGIPDIYSEMLFGVIERIPLPGYSLLLSVFHKPYRLYLEAKRKNA